MFSNTDNNFPSYFEKKGDLFFHPKDNFPYPTEIFEDLKNFVPTPDKGQFSNWGIYPANLDNLQRSLATANRNNLYVDINGKKYDNPHQQFVKKLIELKLQELSKPEIQSVLTAQMVIRGKWFVLLAPSAVEFLTIFFSNFEVTLAHNEQDCWRLISVPASLTLSILHEKVLGPAMGWMHGYHGYMFQDLRDGAAIGPKDYEKYIDMMHVNIQYHGYMDAQDCPLGLVLRKVGDQCIYKYDLVNNWEHIVSLEEVLPAPEGEAGEQTHVVLLDGRGDCPPEDSYGLEKRGCVGYAKFLEQFKASLSSCKKLLREANRSINYQTRGLPFDPLHFSIHYHRLLLAEVARSKGGMAVKCKADYREPFAECFACQGRLKPMSKCARCKTAIYCSKECQANDWSKHKLICATYIPATI